MDLTRFEKARLIGARALQLSNGAPPLVEVPQGVINPVEIAFKEFETGIIPLEIFREE